MAPKSEAEQARERAEQAKRGEHKDLGQQQAEDLNSAEWNQREGSLADPQADTEDERAKDAADKTR